MSTSAALELPVKARTTSPRVGLTFCLVVWLVVRVVFSLWGAWRLAATPPDVYQIVQQHYPEVGLPTRDLAGYLIGVWNIYDTPHYVGIAEHGYTGNLQAETVFFPGYPLLIKAVSVLLLGQSLVAALVVANLAAFLFFWYLYRLVAADYGENVARRAVILSAIFPSSFFLFLGYTEAPLLAGTVMAFYYARQGRWGLAAGLAGAAALIKQPGVFLLIPLGYLYWQQLPAPRTLRAFGRRFDWLWLWLAPLAGVGYSAYRYLVLHTPSRGPGDLGADDRLDIPGGPLIRAILMIRPDNPRLVVNIIDVMFALVMIALVVGVVRKVRYAPYVLYALVLVLVSLSVTWLDAFRPVVNMPRRLLIIFPVFIYLGLVTSNPRVFRLVSALFLALFLSLSALFIDWVFIS